MWADCCRTHLQKWIRTTASTPKKQNNSYECVISPSKIRCKFYMQICLLHQCAELHSASYSCLPVPLDCLSYSYIISVLNLLMLCCRVRSLRLSRASAIEWVVWCCAVQWTSEGVVFPIDGRLVLNPELQLHARRRCAAHRRRRAQSAWNRRRVRPPAIRPLFERLLRLRSSEGLVLFLSRLGSCECLLSERRVRTDASLEVAASAFVCSAAQAGIAIGATGVYTLCAFVWTFVRTRAHTPLAGYMNAHFWEKLAPGNLPPNAIAVWNFGSNQPAAGLLN